MEFKNNDLVRCDPLPKVDQIPDIVPQILISPFSIEYFHNYFDIDWREKINRKCDNKNWHLLPRATAGISLLRKELKIRKITILTTFNTHYISGCVLNALDGVEISRSLDKRSDAIMVIHEWGIEIPDIIKIKEFCNGSDIPLIEDCALTMRPDLGRSGDYILYSFPKIFPMPFGGLLQGTLNKRVMDEDSDHIAHGQKEGLIASLYCKYLGDLNNISIRRKENWNYLNDIFIKADLEPFFHLVESDVPYIYMLHTDRSEGLSTVMKKYGIEAGVYWKNDGLFLPCHQNLSKYHLDYIAGAVLSNIDKCSKNKQ